jgi:hypothetical protein
MKRLLFLQMIFYCVERHFQKYFSYFTTPTRMQMRHYIVYEYKEHTSTHCITSVEIGPAWLRELGSWII